MTRHKEWVKEIDTRKTTNVELENHTTLTIEGMRKYAVEMKDGKIVVTEGWKSICYAKGLFSDLKNNALKLFDNNQRLVLEVFSCKE